MSKNHSISYEIPLNLFIFCTLYKEYPSELLTVLEFWPEIYGATEQYRWISSLDHLKKSLKYFYTQTKRKSPKKIASFEYSLFLKYFKEHIYLQKSFLQGYINLVYPFMLYNRNVAKGIHEIIYYYRQTTSLFDRIYDLFEVRKKDKKRKYLKNFVEKKLSIFEFCFFYFFYETLEYIQFSEVKKLINYFSKTNTTISKKKRAFYSLLATVAEEYSLIKLKNANFLASLIKTKHLEWFVRFYYVFYLKFFLTIFFLEYYRYNYKYQDVFHKFHLDFRRFSLNIIEKANQDMLYLLPFVLRIDYDKVVKIFDDYVKYSRPISLYVEPINYFYYKVNLVIIYIKILQMPLLYKKGKRLETIKISDSNKRFFAYAE